MKLLSKSIDKNPITGLCMKKNATGWGDDVEKLLNSDRKMHFSKPIVVAFKSEGYSESSGVKLEEGNEGSCKTERVRCPSVTTLSNDLVIEEDLTKLVEWPESVLKKRMFRQPLKSSSGLNQLSKSLENIHGLVWLGKHQKGAREKLGTLSTHSLPEEVVEEILSRLPVKSLVRFRCVCKSWHHLSYSERFISLHLKNYRTSQLLLGTCNTFEETSLMYFLPPPPTTGGYSDNDRASQKMVKREFSRSQLLDGSCNGIVCLNGGYAREDIALWNPATKESKIIPKSRLPHKERLLSCSTVGFGFDPKTNDYKILQMVYGEPYPPVADMELYSLRTDSWRKVDCHDFFLMRDITHADIVCRLPFTDNRIVCAAVCPLSGPRKWEILSFDMSSETYEIIPVSPSLDAELGEHKDFYPMRDFKLFPYKEETIAMGIVYCVGEGSLCDIWVLNDFDCMESRCWSKCLTTKLHDCFYLPVGCWGSHILFQENMSGKLIRFDSGNNIMVELGVFYPTYVTATVYKESLVRINYTKCWC